MAGLPLDPFRGEYERIKQTLNLSAILAKLFGIHFVLFVHAKIEFCCGLVLVEKKRRSEGTKITSPKWRTNLGYLPHRESEVCHFANLKLDTKNALTRKRTGNLLFTAMYRCLPRNKSIRSILEEAIFFLPHPIPPHLHSSCLRAS